MCIYVYVYIYIYICIYNNGNNNNNNNNNDKITPLRMFVSALKYGSENPQSCLQTISARSF